MAVRSEVIFDRNVVEFVTVAAEYCRFLESCEGAVRSEFVDTLLKLLPLLYLKGCMLPECEWMDEGEDLEQFVTEEEYEVLRLTLAEVMASRDDYLDVVVPYGQGHLVSIAHKRCHIISESHEAEGTRLCLYAPPDCAHLFRALQ